MKPSTSQGKETPSDVPDELHGHQLANVTSGKYLGVSLHEKLLWNKHVDDVSKKANNSLAFLRRNVSSCPQDVKAQCYKTLVRPILEYAAPVWDPYTATNITKLEAVQRLPARFVTGDFKTTSSASQMIATLGWPTLQQRRTDNRLVLTYKIIYNLIEIPAQQFFRPATVSLQRGRNVCFLVPFCRTDLYRHSFFPVAVRLWNQLPAATATADTLDSFKAGLASLH